MSATPSEAIGQATAAQLAEHLARCDTAFEPPLSSRVSLDPYAAKLVENAVCVEAWAANRLIASVAMYCGDDAFISNVSVDPQWMRRGLAAQLLRRAVSIAWQRGMPRVRLEVAADNAAAIALYRRTGFVTAAEQHGTLTMHLLNQDGATHE